MEMALRCERRCVEETGASAAAALLAEFRKNKRVRWAETTADVREYRADAEEEDLKLQMWEQIKRKTKEAKLAVREARLATASRCGMHLALDLANAAPFCDFGNPVLGAVKLTLSSGIALSDALPGGTISSCSSL